MAAQVVFPQNDQGFDDRAGVYLRVFNVEIPTSGENHEIELGERGLDSAVQLSGPGTLTLTSPSGTSQTGGIDSGDQTKRVTANGSVKGLYKVAVEHTGRNPAAL